MELGSAPTWRLATADFVGIPPRLLEDAARLERALGRALGGRPVTWLRHEFSPRGVSLAAVCARVRVVLHTWPEVGEATLDVWSSDDPSDIVEAALLRLSDEASSGCALVSTKASDDDAE